MASKIQIGLRKQLRLKPLKEQVIVITGASSGIGLETALSAARRGAKLVLAARNGEALADVVQRIRAIGGEAVDVVADISDRRDVQRIAQSALSYYGGFDTWINNAGVEIWGRFEDGSEDEYRRLFDINFWGLVYGSEIAAKHLKERGGALINIGSVESDRAFPLQGIYAASKHAVKAFTDAYRMELEKEGAPISVTLIKPSSIATPLPQHAVNHMEREVKLPSPLYRAEEVAQAILHAAEHCERDIIVGGGGKLMATLGKFAPRMMDRLSESLHFEGQKREEPARPRQHNLDQPGFGGQVEGEHPGQRAKSSLYTRSALHPVLVGSLVAGLGLGMVALFLGKGRSKNP